MGMWSYNNRRFALNPTTRVLSIYELRITVIAPFRAQRIL